MTATWKARDVNPIYVSLEVAFGAALTADPSTWTWTDITPRMKGSITITRGRADESTETQPSNCTVTLENTDGWLTPYQPVSPWRLKWGLGTQMRVKVRNPTTGVSFIRCQGGVSEILPQWPAGNSGYAVVVVTFKGVLYRLGQGTDLRSAMYRLISADKPIAYWPMEDGKNASALAEYHGGPAMNIADGAGVGSGGPANGASSSLVTLQATTTLFAPVTMATSVTSWSLEWYMNLPSAPSAGVAIWQWHTLGTARLWWLALYPLAGIDVLHLNAYDASNRQLLDLTTTFTSPTGAEAYGTDLYVSVCVRQNAGAINAEFAGSSYAGLGFGTTSGTFTGTLGPIVDIGTAPLAGQFGGAGWVLGHLSVWDKIIDASFGTDNFAHAKSLNGQSGDAADTRISKVAAAAGVPYRLRATPPLTLVSKMGVLAPGSALAAMREAEKADIGILADGLNAGVDYLPRSVRYNLPVSLTLDGANQQIKLPFAPIDSDQRLRNSETISRSNGSSFTATAANPALAGFFGEQLTLNLSDDNDLDNQANFRLNLNSVAELRVPSLSMDLRDRPELIQPWLDNCDLGARVQAKNLPRQFPVSILDQVIEQYTETLDAVTWNVTIVGSPFAPWRAFVLDDATLGRLDTAGSSLATGVSATGTSWSVTTPNGPLWTTASGDRPFDLDCEGEQVTVTNLTGSSSPQTFTVTRSVNGVVKTHSASAVVSLWHPAVLAL